METMEKTCYHEGVFTIERIYYDGCSGAPIHWEVEELPPDCFAQPMINTWTRLGNYVVVNDQPDPYQIFIVPTNGNVLHECHHCGWFVDNPGDAFCSNC